MAVLRLLGLLAALLFASPFIILSLWMIWVGFRILALMFVPWA